MNAHSEGFVPVQMSAKVVMSCDVCGSVKSCPNVLDRVPPKMNTAGSHTVGHGSTRTEARRTVQLVRSLRVFGVSCSAGDRKSTRLNSSHVSESRMPSSA